MRAALVTLLKDLAALPDDVSAAPPRRRRVALLYGLACHGSFALGVGAMIFGMYFGMTQGAGGLSGASAWTVNALLLLQFPIGHSLLLTRWGRAQLARLAPAPHGADLVATTYAAAASVQLLALFALWSPSGVVWFLADGAAFWLLTAAYGTAWLVLGKAMMDSGIELQSGLLGWRAVLRGRTPRYPDMPVDGLYRYTRHPIYLAFACTLWTTPVWTPDQLMVAVSFSAYCLLGPLHKEARFRRIYGARYDRFRATRPYFWLRRRPAAAAAAIDDGTAVAAGQASAPSHVTGCAGAPAAATDKTADGDR